MSKFDLNGNLIWFKTIGTSADELSYAITVDDSGNAFIAGRTEGNLSGSLSGGQDAFIAKFDTNGTHQWTQQLGTTANDDVRRIILSNDQQETLCWWFY